MNSSTPVHILLVEDNEGDVVLAREAFSDSRIRNTISVAHDGQEALDMIFREKEYANFPSPDLILLDINLPRVNGKEVLGKLKEHGQYKNIPVVILTTSDDENDIIESYRNHVNCYLVKPVDISKFLQMITAIENFWLSLVKLPTHLS